MQAADNTVGALQRQESELQENHRSIFTSHESFDRDNHPNSLWRLLRRIAARKASSRWNSAFLVTCLLDICSILFWVPV